MPSKRRRIHSATPAQVHNVSSFLEAAALANYEPHFHGLDARDLLSLRDHDLIRLGLNFAERVRYHSTLNTLAATDQPSTIKCLVITHVHCLLHKGSAPSSGESASRVTSLLEHFGSIFANNPQVAFDSNPPLAQIHALWRVHPPSYVSRILKMSPSPETNDLVHFSPGGAGQNTFISSGSTDAIFRAAGAVVSAVDAVFKGYAHASKQIQSVETAFCIVRPPGHHCGWTGVASLGTGDDMSQGFCYVNNVMVGAAHALNEYAARAAIIDFDVHHGNGTEDIIRHLFASYPSNQHLDSITSFPYLFISTHQYGIDSALDPPEPFYPGTGSALDATDPLHPYIINIPLAPNTTSPQFRIKASKALVRLKAHNPDVIFFSAGFDSHYKDSAGDLNLTDDDYRWLSAECRKACGKVVSVLEGGYDEGDLAEGLVGGLLSGAENHVRGLIS
ncbi:hypothetical protein SeLEV6574_g06722 [Synchytrium endobioticum]|uniref:Histone deacetylase domain-containing protein n=1 Tax=Synchytrium endobioticum TaxID=286115 RepID=A0A507CMI5_9FUNG|nr:hypothetical protein SeLEV6574_g06722 [Synchytrium endobioticum]